MLKARKKITKKEIKHDPFLETVSQVKEYVEKNQKLITRVGIGVVAIIIIGMIMNKNIASEKDASETALGKAFVSLGTGDKDNGLLQLELLVDDYTGSEAAQRGLFMLARINYEQKDYLTAQSYLQDFLDDPTEEFHAGALLLMADLEKMNGNANAVAGYLNQAIKQATNVPEKDKYTIALADHYIHTGEYKEAQLLAESIIDKYPNSSELKNKAEEIIGYLHTVFSDEQ